MPRPLELAYGGPAPAPDGKGVPVWIRSGWDVSPDAVRADAREAGLDSPLVLVYLPKRSDDALKKALAAAKAAEDTLHTKGVPTEAEGRDARKAMETRLEAAERDVRLALDDVFRGAQVFLAGGSEVGGDTLAQKPSRRRRHDALQRLFPDFEEADDLRWSKVFEQAKRGATAALEAVDYKGKPGDTPRVRRRPRLRRRGEEGGRGARPLRGRPVRVAHRRRQRRPRRAHAPAASSAPPATAQPVEAKELDPRGINQVRFQVEDVVLTFPERLAIAGLFQNADSTIGAKPNEVHLHVGEFLRAMRALASRAGGDAPLPPAPAPPVLDEVAALTGNAQLRGSSRPQRRSTR